MKHSEGPSRSPEWQKSSSCLGAASSYKQNPDCITARAASARAIRWGQACAGDRKSRAIIADGVRVAGAKEAGYRVVDGQKVPMGRRCRSVGRRLRAPDKREQRMGGYELFQQCGPMQASGWDNLMRALSTRNYNYGAGVRIFRTPVASKNRR